MRHSLAVHRNDPRSLLHGDDIQVDRRLSRRQQAIRDEVGNTVGSVGLPQFSQAPVDVVEEDVFVRHAQVADRDARRVRLGHAAKEAAATRLTECVLGGVSWVFSKQREYDVGFLATPAHVLGQHLHLDNFVLGDHQGPQVLSNAAAGGGAVFCLLNLDPFGEQSDGLLVGPESLEPQSKPVTQMVEEKGLKVM